MLWKTRINKMTQTQYPLIMAAFAGFSNVNLVASFSNAGGLGVITALNFDKKEFKKKLQNVRDLTDKPFGVNISVAPPNVKRSRGVLTEEDYLDYVEIALNQNVKIITTSAYQASFIGDRVHEAGCYWFHKCALLKHAISAEKAGADAITTVGLEAAGFKNPLQHSTLVNLTIGKKELRVPLIAAGGIGDARGFLGALAMGAEAVCFGTAIMTTKEFSIGSEEKKRWLKTEIFNEEYYKELYHFSLKGTRVSPAIGHRNEIIPIKSFIEDIILESESILKSWGFTGNEFNTIP